MSGQRGLCLQHPKGAWVRRVELQAAAVEPAQSGQCAPELPVTPAWRECGHDSDTPELCALEQSSNARLICCVDHTVQLKGAVGKGALEDAHLPQPVLQLPSEQAMQVRYFQVEGACSLWGQQLTLKLKGVQSSIAKPLEETLVLGALAHLSPVLLHIRGLCSGW